MQAEVQLPLNSWMAWFAYWLLAATLSKRTSCVPSLRTVWNLSPSCCADSKRVKNRVCVGQETPLSPKVPPIPSRPVHSNGGPPAQRLACDGRDLTATSTPAPPRPPQTTGRRRWPSTTRAGGLGRAGRPRKTRRSPERRTPGTRTGVPPAAGSRRAPLF